MAKFLIQDIMPPEKRKRAQGGATHGSNEQTTPSVSTHVSHTTKHQSHKKVTHEIASAPNDMVEETHQEYTPRNPAEFESDDLSYEVAQETSDELPVVEEERYDVPPVRTYFKHNQVQEVFKQGDPFHDEFERQKRANTNATIIKGIFAAVAAVSLFVIGATVLGGATVTITPKHEPVSIQSKAFQAEKTPMGYNLPYSVMQVDLTETIDVPATGQKTVTAKASGKIVVYNEASASPQRLIKNTRFQEPGGKIYRINQSISIPGYKTVSGKIVPGSIEVTAYADEAGPNYNIGLVDFTIPGLKGDPRYSKMYARSKTSMTGGASGVIKQVNEEELNKAQNDLKVSLETKLRTKARSYVTENQIAFPQGYFIEFGEPAIKDPTGAATADKATVEQQGSIAVVIFDRRALAQSIAKSLVPGYNGESVTVPNLEAIGFTTKKTLIKELIEGSRIDFTLNGEADLRYDIDPVAIKKQLAGIEKKSFTGLMAGMPMIENAKLKIRPFWKSTLPANVEDISIIIQEKTTQ